jgi:iron complex outermembrane receptor protein
VVQPSPPGSANPQETVVKNAASATIKGFEMEAIAQLSKELSYNMSFTYTDAKYDSFFNDVVGLTTGSAADGIPDNVATLTLRRAPEFQWSTGLNYTHETNNGRIDATTLLRYQTKYATCIVPNSPVVPGAVTNDLRCVTKDRENLSAQVGYTFILGPKKELSVSLFGRNLTDVRDIAATLPVAGLFAFSSAIPPRTFGVEVGFKF